MDKLKDNNFMLKASMLTAVSGGALMFISMFLPYVTGARGSISSVSMVSYAQLANDLGNTYFKTSSYGALYFGIVGLIGLFSVLSIVFSFRKKHIPSIIFTVLSFLVFYLLCWDFRDRKVVRDGGLSWGAAYYLFILGAVAAIGGAVYMAIIKKKQIKNTTDTEEK